MAKILFIISLVLSSPSMANDNIFDSFKEGLYGSNSYVCGRNVIVNRIAKKIYLEIAENPIHDYDCDGISIPVAEAKCPDLTGQNCKISNSSKIDLLSDSMFVLTSPNGETHIYRWVE